MDKDMATAKLQNTEQAWLSNESLENMTIHMFRISIIKLFK